MADTSTGSLRKSESDARGKRKRAPSSTLDTSVPNPFKTLSLFLKEGELREYLRLGDKIEGSSDVSKITDLEARNYRALMELARSREALFIKENKRRKTHGGYTVKDALNHLSYEEIAHKLRFMDTPRTYGKGEFYATRAKSSVMAGQELVQDENGHWVWSDYPEEKLSAAGEAEVGGMDSVQRARADERIGRIEQSAEEWKVRTPKDGVEDRGGDIQKRKAFARYDESVGREQKRYEESLRSGRTIQAGKALTVEERLMRRDQMSPSEVSVMRSNPEYTDIKRRLTLARPNLSGEEIVVMADDVYIRAEGFMGQSTTERQAVSRAVQHNVSEKWPVLTAFRKQKQARLQAQRRAQTQTGIHAQNQTQARLQAKAPGPIPSLEEEMYQRFADAGTDFEPPKKPPGIGKAVRRAAKFVPYVAGAATALEAGAAVKDVATGKKTPAGATADYFSDSAPLADMQMKQSEIMTKGMQDTGKAIRNKIPKTKTIARQALWGLGLRL